MRSSQRQGMWAFMLAFGAALLCLRPAPALAEPPRLAGDYIDSIGVFDLYKVDQEGSNVKVSTSHVDVFYQSDWVLIFECSLGSTVGQEGECNGRRRSYGGEDANGKPILLWLPAKLTFKVGAKPRQFSIWKGGAKEFTAVEEESSPDPEPGAPIQFVDEKGKPVDIVASFSQPAPTVELDPMPQTPLTVSSGAVMLKLSGTVRSRLADIVPGKRADIAEVFVEYFAPADAEPSGRKRVSVRVPVMPQASGAPDRLRPFPFQGRFSTSVQIPLAHGGTSVSVRARDLLGAEGYDSIAIDVQSKSWKTVETERIPAFMPGEVTTAEIKEVVESKSTAPGLFNPVWIRINDPALSSGGSPSASVSIGEKPMKIVRREDGSLYAEVPVIAVAAAPSGVLNVLDASRELVVRYGTKEKKLGWAVTTHSPSKYYHYAAGTEVTHEVLWDGFKNYDVVQVTPIRKEPRKDSAVDVVDRENITVNSPVPVQDGKALVRMRLGKDAWRSPRWALQFSLRHKTDAALQTTATIGDFGVVPLRTIIIGVDGLAFSHALSANTFRAAFSGPGACQERALSALPTITWANWAGIMSGQRPAHHGIQGNSFFARGEPFEGLPPHRPFNSDTRGTFVSLFLQSREVVGQGLDGLAMGSARSIYDDLAEASDQSEFPLEVYSINMWYRRSQKPRVVVRSDSYNNLNPLNLGHGPFVANRLDVVSGDDAMAAFRAHRDSLGVMTVYFPGPDNIAHDIGDQPIPLPASLYTGYTPGPALPNVQEPLRAIAQHLRKVTDEQLKRLYDAVHDAGYEYATLFVLVADHGLHAYRTDPEHLIHARGDRELGNLFSGLGLRVWTGGPPVVAPLANVDNFSAVYAPNGGLGHLYVRGRGGAAPWQERPGKQDVALVARQLFLEATSGFTEGPNGRERVPDCGEGQLAAGFACFADRTSLGPLGPARSGPRVRGRNGALGSPPAIFVRMPEGPQTGAFRWLKGINLKPTNSPPREGEDLLLAPIQEFIDARKAARNEVGTKDPIYPRFAWPAFEARLEEMNDRGIRTGDIVFITDGDAGYIALNEGEEFNGWHGGPTVSESDIPLFFNIPGDVVNEAVLADAIRAVKAGRKGDAGQDYRLRNWEMGSVLKEIYSRLYGRNGM